MASIVRDELLDPEMLAELQTAVREISAEHRREAGAGQEPQRRRLHTLDQTVARLVDAIADMRSSLALAERLRAAEAERLQIQQALASVTQPQRDAIAVFRSVWGTSSKRSLMNGCLQ